jgi:hypothetical protein
MGETIKSNDILEDIKRQKEETFKQRKKRLATEPTILLKRQQALYNEHWEQFKRYIGKTTREIHKKPKHSKDDKIFVFACLHIPFQREDLFVRSVEEAVARGCKIACIAGDFLDCYGVCPKSFDRNKRFHIPIRDEVMEGQIYIEYLADRFDKIYILLGNHLDRVRKWFAERVGPENMWLVQYNLMEFMTEKYGNFEVIENAVDGNEVNWLWRFNDLLVTHREVGSKIPMRPTVNTHDLMQNWNHVFGMDDYRCLVEVHTHMMGSVPFLGGKYLLMEGGCLCKTMQYSVEANMKYPHPQTCGYQIVSMRGGMVDFKNTHQRFFEYNEHYSGAKL